MCPSSFVTISAAVRGNAAFTVSDLEARREGPSFTVDTLHALRARHPGARGGGVAHAPVQADPVAIDPITGFVEALVDLGAGPAAPAADPPELH